jgi:hypothetical protein
VCLGFEVLPVVVMKVELIRQHIIIGWYHLDVGSVGDVLETYAAFVFMVELWR